MGRYRVSWQRTENVAAYVRPLHELGLWYLPLIGAQSGRTDTLFRYRRAQTIAQCAKDIWDLGSYT